MTGRCLCKGVRYEITEAPTVMANCHCTRCQHFGGGGYSTVVVTSPEHLRITQGEELLGVYSEEGFGDRVFCSKCGSSLYARGEGAIYVEAGTLEQDPGLRPQFHMMTAYKAPWVQITDDLQQFPEYPSME
jgi:hypothetical protein